MPYEAQPQVLQVKIFKNWKHKTILVRKIFLWIGCLQLDFSVWIFIM